MTNHLKKKKKSLPVTITYQKTHPTRTEATGTSRRHLSNLCRYKEHKTLISHLADDWLWWKNQPKDGGRSTSVVILKHTLLCVESQRAHLHVVGMLRFMSDINQPNFPTRFYSVLVSVSVFMALSTVFHSINSPGNSAFSLCSASLISALLSFQLYISL